MNIDLHTLILVIGILHLMQVLIFFHQYKTNKFLKGPGWWLTWSAIECLGFGFILLRGIPSLVPLSIFFQNIFIFTGTIFIYIGVLRFLERRVNWKFLGSFFASYVVLHLTFIFVRDDINLRTLVFDIYLSIIAFITAFALYQNKNQSISTTVNFNVAVFIAHGCIFAYRSVMIVFGTHVDHVFEPSLFNLVQYFDALVVGLLWTIGFIIMLNQRLNAEILEAKTHFEQIFNTSPDAVLITRFDDGLIVDFNENFLKVFGFTKEDLIGKTTLDINLWKDTNNRHELVRVVNEKGFAENFEVLMRRKDGGLINGLVSAKNFSLDEIPHLITVTRDITSLKEAEEKVRRDAETLTFLAQYSSIEQGKDFFAKLAQHLASALDANFVCIDLLEGDGLNARTLAVWNDGNFEDNVVYALKDTPCGDVVGKQVCCFPASVTKFFPRDTVLQDLEAESYVGVTLWSHTGTPIGLIAVIKKKPLNNQKEAEDLLKLVAIRASAELERMKSEEILKESEKRYVLTLDAINDGLWDWNTQTGDAFFSPNYYSLLGYDFQEFPASYKSWRQLVHPEELESVEKQLKHSIENGKGFAIDLRMKMRSGNWQWLSTRGKVVERDTNGKALRLVGTLSDITHRKLAEQALIESEERFRNLVWDMQVGLLLQGPNTEIFMSNPKALELLDINEDQLLGKSSFDPDWNVIHEDGSPFPGNTHPVPQAIATNQSVRDVVMGVYRPTKGDRMWLKVDAELQRNKDGSIRQVVCSFIDISDRKRSEMEIKVKNKKLEELSLDKDRFISILAHDLKSPFNTILGYLDLLTENIHHYDIKKIENQISIINSSAQNAYLLLEDILIWARSESGKIPFKPQEINLSDISKEIIEMLTPSATAKGLTINQKVEPNITVDADLDMLKTILRNLISNSIKFTNKGGIINLNIVEFEDLKIRKAAEFLSNFQITDFSNSQIISISDDGVGMAPDVLSKLFESSRIHSTKGTSNESGIGLGLSLCKEFVEKHGGKIWAESKPGKGSTFYFSLPLNNKL
jgi:two-component system sensor histidine kinase/response regulator